MRRGVWGLLFGLTAAVASAQAPMAKLDNGVLRATVYLPDAAKGFYRGTRFDWSGVIGELTYSGHRYYGPWFTKMEPGVNDFVFDGQEITAGSASAITGPVDGFMDKNGDPLGFNEAAPGKTFVKIGVGVLRRPDDAKYSSYRAYEIVDGGTWRVRTKPDKITFTQTIVDAGSGYGYLYTKVLRLEPGKPVMVMEHTLKDLGRLPIDTRVFNHNFLVLDQQTTGPDFSIHVPFPIVAQKPIKQELGSVDGNEIEYKKRLEDRESFTVAMGGFGSTAKDYDIRIENTRVGAGMRITGDRPLADESLWSIRSTIAVEPFVRLQAAPGETIRWSYTYTYYTLPAAK